MSPYVATYYLREEQALLSARISNKFLKCSQERDITVAYHGKPLLGASIINKGQDVGYYKCIKVSVGYCIIRTTFGDTTLVAKGLARLIDCQMKAIEDYCIISSID